MEVGDLEAAKSEAQEFLPEMARDGLPDGDGRAFIISVRDEAEQVVLRAALSVAMEHPFNAPD